MHKRLPNIRLEDLATEFCTGIYADKSKFNNMESFVNSYRFEYSFLKEQESSIWVRFASCQTRHSVTFSNILKLLALQYLSHTDIAA